MQFRLTDCFNNFFLELPVVCFIVVNFDFINIRWPDCNTCMNLHTYMYTYMFIYISLPSYQKFLLMIFMNVFCSMKMYICKLVILHNFSLYFSVVHIFEIMIFVIKLLLTYQIISESLYF